MSADCKLWQFWVDRGGTFTDIVARDPRGQLFTYKLLSKNPAHYADAISHGIKHFVADQSHLVEAVRIGTTIGTNALLERQGARTLFVTTTGFKDAIEIGYQNRPDIFALRICKPAMLYERVLEVDERVTADGDLLTALDLEAARAGLLRALQEGIKSCAITLMHGYRFTEHEKQLCSLALELGFQQVCVSHAVAPVVKFVSRADTTLVDAYLSPLLHEYLKDLADNFPQARISIMQSGGGLVAASEFRGKDSVLSGPAGGIVGAIKTASIMGLQKIITFDMGGTSTDVAHFQGEIERSFETQVAGVRLRAPMITIHTVAAGGGSVLHFDGARFAVGPDSAGAFPGPACYRNGGPLTVTDCNVLLGRIQGEFFPAVFGARGNERLDKGAVDQEFEKLVAQLPGRSVEEIAAGFLDIAVMHMAQAIKKISVQRGYDITDYSLFCFGGAGGQHACLIADALGISRVVIHPLAGVLSALGMGLADLQVLKQTSVEAHLDAAGLEAARDALRSLQEQAAAELASSSGTADGTRFSFRHRAYLRYENTEAALSIEISDPARMRRDFEEQHRVRYGFASPDKKVVISWVTIEATASGHQLDKKEVDTDGSSTAPDDAAPECIAPAKSIRLYSRGRWHDAPLYIRAKLPRGARIDGPALIAESTATTCIEHGWQATVGVEDALVLTRSGTIESGQSRRIALDKADPVYLEVFNSLFMFIAEQMGETLQMTSRSVNIKERLDFSCAVFDGQGELIANAPHIPVHLGSMSDSVKSLIAARGNQLRPGDAFAHNDPYDGGTHLPDITVISPCFDQQNTKLLFFVASRGHHADVGGITPGSMPAESRTVSDEGVLLRHVQILKDGRFNDGELLALFRAEQHPPRNIEQNLADLMAQVAANNRGIQELLKAVSVYGQDVVERYMEFVQTNAEAAVRRAISVMKDGSYSCKMDDGATIKVAISVHGAADTASATIDFTGTSAQRSNNLNAPLSVCRAAVLYVFRTLVEEPIPLNAGCLRPLNLVVPQGSMLNPVYPAAVVAGNVETSQVICDALYGALGVMAASQGTMNNFTFGNERYQYYETIAGGSGAGRTFDGAAVVQTNMTNSRLTDPEILETRFPVLLEEFSIRPASGGRGRHKGGAGAVRRIRFLQPMTATILSNRRSVAPPGLLGGADGDSGKNYVLREGKARQALSSTQSVDMQAGDVFVVETPGGAGFEPA